MANNRTPRRICVQWEPVAIDKYYITIYRRRLGYWCMDIVILYLSRNATWRIESRLDANTQKEAPLPPMGTSLWIRHCNIAAVLDIRVKACLTGRPCNPLSHRLCLSVCLSVSVSVCVYLPVSSASNCTIIPVTDHALSLDTSDEWPMFSLSFAPNDDRRQWIESVLKVRIYHRK